MPILFQRRCVALVNLKFRAKPMEEDGKSLCGPLLLTAQAEWINQTNGLGTLVVSRSGRRRGWDGRRESPHLWKINCRLSSQNPTWWGGSEVAPQRDSGLLVTLRRELRLRLAHSGREESWGKWLKKERGGEGERDMDVDHRFPLVQGKFIGTLARIRVICFSCSLVPWVHLSAFTVCSTWQKGRRLYEISSSQERVFCRVKSSH